MKWDLRFIELAQHVARWSKDPSTKVGAVITDSKNRIISLGYNGFPRDVPDDIIDREHKLRCTIHAEENAMLFAQRSLEGTTCYVTQPPCATCAAKLIQAGVSRVVFAEATDDFASRWWKDIALAESMYRHAGVRVSIVSVP